MVWQQIGLGSRRVWRGAEASYSRRSNLASWYIALQQVAYICYSRWNAIDFFSAAGNPEISIYTDALIYNDGTVVWKPPAIYKSFCEVSAGY